MRSYDTGSVLPQIKSEKLRSKLEEEGQPDEDSVLVFTFGDNRFSWVDIPESDLIGFGLHMQELREQNISTTEQFQMSFAGALFQWNRLNIFSGVQMFLPTLYEWERCFAGWRKKSR